MKITHPDFDSRAAQWDALPRRVALANTVVDTIIQIVHPQAGMRMLDYGAGTGLVTLGLQPLVKEVIAVDSSRGMLEQLEAKACDAGISNLKTLFIDLDQPLLLPVNLDLLVSSMTMHHVPHIAPLLAHFKDRMNSGSYLCIADLEQEDGSFHDDGMDVPHKGFAIAEMEGYFLQAGFMDVKTVRVLSIQKERNGVVQEYPVNLTVGRG